MAQSQRPPVHPEHQETEAERTQRAAAEEQKARDDAAAATAHLPRQGDPLKPPMSPAEAAAPGEPTVSMIIPEGGVTLTLPGYRMVYFPPGIQDVPVSMAEHSYLVDSGVTPAAGATRQRPPE